MVTQKLHLLTKDDAFFCFNLTIVQKWTGGTQHCGIILKRRTPQPTQWGGRLDPLGPGNSIIRTSIRHDATTGQGTPFVRSRSMGATKRRLNPRALYCRGGSAVPVDQSQRAA